MLNALINGECDATQSVNLLCISFVKSYAFDIFVLVLPEFYEIFRYFTVKRTVF